MFVLFLGSISREGVGAPSPELLASLQSLRDNVDSTLLPHSLHQVCKGGSFPCAERFLSRRDQRFVMLAGRFLQVAAGNRKPPDL